MVLAACLPAGDWTKTRLANMSANDQKRRESATGSNIGRKISAWEGRPMVYPSNVLHRPPVCHNTGHSAAFPEWLPEFFIKLFTNEGDIVLDPFLGSGTTYRKMDDRMFGVPCPECGKGTIEPVRFQNYKTKVKANPFVVPEQLWACAILVMPVRLIP